MPEPDTNENIEVSQWRRLHVATLLVEVVRRLLSLAWFVILVLVLLFVGGKPNPAEYAFVAIAVAQVLSPVMTYLTLRYAIEGDVLIVHSGLLFRRHRTIRRQRIQNINLSQGVLHRALGVASLSIETAVSARPEAELSCVHIEEAKRIRARMLRTEGDAESTEQKLADAEAKPIWRVTAKDLFIVGVTENRMALILGGTIYLWQEFNELLLPYYEGFGRYINEYFAPAKQVATDTVGESEYEFAVVSLAFALVFVAFLILGTIASIVMTFLTHYGFTLRQKAGRLRLQYGMFTKHESVLPLMRVQLAKIYAPLLRRLLGYATVYVETAGTATSNDGAGATPLCPLIRQERISNFVNLPFPELPYEDVPWKRVSHLTIRRGFMRYLILQLLVIVVVALRYPQLVLSLAMLSTVAASIGARLRYKTLGYAISGNYLLVRAGIVNRRVWIIPRAKVQSIQVARTLFQRRYKLANLTTSTAGGSHIRPPTIFDLAEEDAKQLQDSLSRDANQAGEWLLDGV